MIIEDKFVVSAPTQQVWDFFLDIPKISTCIPGAEKVEQIDDETFSGTLVVKVGPIKANFSGKATLTEVEPPYRITAKGQGKDKNTASMVSATFTAILTELEPGQTEVAHNVDVAIRGRLGQFGQGVIRETAKQVTQAFVTCVQAKIAGQAEPQSNLGANQSDISTSTASQAHSPRPPSLLSIIFKSIITAIGNWLRAMRPGSKKSTG